MLRLTDKPNNERRLDTSSVESEQTIDIAEEDEIEITYNSTSVPLEAEIKKPSPLVQFLKDPLQSINKFLSKPEQKSEPREELWSTPSQGKSTNTNNKTVKCQTLFEKSPPSTTETTEFVPEVSPILSSPPPIPAIPGSPTPLSQTTSTIINPFTTTRVTIVPTSTTISTTTTMAPPTSTATGTTTTTTTTMAETKGPPAYPTFDSNMAIVNPSFATAFTKSKEIKPPKFKGEVRQSVRPFLNDFIIVTHLNNWDVQESIRQLMCGLERKAKTWLFYSIFTSQRWKSINLA